MTGVRSNQALFSWALATIIVLAAVFGPPLTGDSLPALVELRHDVLMIDREFDGLGRSDQHIFITNGGVA
jgi:hypothetical protein